MKSEILNLRIPSSLKDTLTDEATHDGVTVSDLVRDILSAFYNLEERYKLFPGSKISFYNSSDFMYLVTWMFEKRLDNYDTNSVHAFEGLKKIAMKAMNDPDLPIELRKEFEKVYVDLARFIYGFGTSNNYLMFCLPNQAQSFNYSLLVNFIFEKPFENTYYI